MSTMAVLIAVYKKERKKKREEKKRETLSHEMMRGRVKEIKITFCLCAKVKRK